MPKTPEQTGLEARTKICDSIVPRLSDRRQYPHPQERSPQQPDLPPHLDGLLDHPWSLESSRRIDFWIWYCDHEFGGIQ